MRYERVVDFDYNNGDGIAVTLWLTGCPHKCKGCHNPQLFDPNRGNPDYLEALSKILYALDEDDVDKHLSILGGEPLAPYNIEGVIHICKFIRNRYPNKKIWVWTGYSWEDLDVRQQHLLQYIDYLVDGKFMEDLKIENKWYGSSNQRLIDVQLSLKHGHVVQYI